MITVNTSSRKNPVIVILGITLKSFRWAALLVLLKQTHAHTQLHTHIHTHGALIHSVFTIQFTICRLNYLPSSYNLFLNILRWEGWNFNRQLLLRLHRHEREKKPHLQNTPAPPCDFVRVQEPVCERRHVRAHSVCLVHKSVLMHGAGLSKGAVHILR